MPSDVVVEHFEELAFLWGQRRRALFSADYLPVQLADLEWRVEMHLKGLVYGADAGMLLEKLAGDDGLEAFAAAYAMLRGGRDDAARAVLDALAGAEADRLEGVRDALGHACPSRLLPAIQQLAAGAPGPVAAAAAEVLCFRAPEAARAVRIERLVKHEDPQVRCSAWRVAARTGVTRQAAAYQAGLNDPDPAVRRQALLAAGWSREPWLLEQCRAAAARPSAQKAAEIELLAIVGTPQDLPLLLGRAVGTVMGPGWFDVLGALGHPEVVPVLIQAMNGPDPETASAAGAAFTRITGSNVASGRRVAVAPAGGPPPDEFEKEFLDEVMLPDPAAARAIWEKVGARYRGATRWCRGMDMGSATHESLMRDLDLESRGRACMRARYEGKWQGTLTQLEALST